MRSTLFITILACQAMFSLQRWSDERRLALTKQYHHARRLGFKFPKQFCKPAHNTGVFIIDTAIMCAVEAIIPGAGKIAKLIKKGKKIADKFGVMKKIEALKHKAEAFIMSKFLGIFGCKVRRMQLRRQRRKWHKKHNKKHNKKHHKKHHKKFHKPKFNKLKNFAAKAKKLAAKASKVAKAGAKFASKHMATIKKIICPVVKPLCKPACGAAISAVRAAATPLAVTYHIPVDCLSNAMEVGCKKLCVAICGRRRLRIRKL